MNGLGMSSLSRWLRADWSQICVNWQDYWRVLRDAKRNFTELVLITFAVLSLVRLFQGRGSLPAFALAHQKDSFFSRLTDAGTQYLLTAWPLWLSVLALSAVIALGLTGILRRHYWMRYAAMSTGFIYWAWLALDILVHTGIAGTAYCLPALLCWGVAGQVLRLDQDEKDKLAGIYPRVRPPSPWAWTLRLRGKYGKLKAGVKPWKAGVKPSGGGSVRRKAV